MESLDSGCTSTMPSEEVAEPSSDAEIEPEDEQGQQFTVTCSHPNTQQYSCALGVHFTLSSLYTSVSQAKINLHFQPPYNCSSQKQEAKNGSTKER